MARLEVVRPAQAPVVNADPTEADIERAYRSFDQWTTDEWVEFWGEQWGNPVVEEWDGSEIEAAGYLCVGGAAYFTPEGHPNKLVRVVPEQHTCPVCGTPQ